MKMKNLALAGAFAFLAAILGCSKTSFDKECIYQTALLQSLMQGDYYGSVSVKELKKMGDTGIGTFDSINGELVMVDGVVYSALGDGTLKAMADDETVPFSNVTFVEPDYKVSLKDVDSAESLKEKLTSLIKTYGANYFYMVKISGKFDSIQYRSELKQKEPFKPLALVMVTDQVIFEDSDIPGTLVALYCPNYMNGLNTAGWHFHFVNDDRSKGGHVLNVKFGDAEAIIDKTMNFKMILPEGKFFNSLDLSLNQDAAIKKVEKNED